MHGQTIGGLGKFSPFGRRNS